MAGLVLLVALVGFVRLFELDGLVGQSGRTEVEVVWRACMVRLVSHVKVDRAVRLVWTVKLVWVV